MTGRSKEGNRKILAHLGVALTHVLRLQRKKVHLQNYVISHECCQTEREQNERVLNKMNRAPVEVLGGLSLPGRF